MSIRQLPHEVVEKIASSSSVISLNDAVCGLVKNSLDANAQKINIFLDYVRGNCTVEDDGEGISADEFGIGGGLAMPNSTSRYPYSPRYHGRHGNFLASIAALSLVIIESRTVGEETPSSLTIHQRDAVSREPAASRSHQLDAFSPGTRVAIFDLFGSMPVRVKHRASELSTFPNIEREFKRLGHELMALLLAWPSSVSVFLRETRSKCQLRLRLPGEPALEQRASRLFTQLGLSESDESSSWIPVAASNGRISIEGSISTIPVATRKSQFLSFGISPLGSSSNGDILLDEVNEIFASSSFGLRENTGPEEFPARHLSPMKWQTKKPPEKWPMLYLKIKCNEVDVDCLWQPRNPSLSAIMALLRAVCYAFLKKHEMRPRKLTHPQRQPAIIESEESSFSSPRREANVPGSEDTANPFDGWRQVKVGNRAGRAPVRSYAAPKPRLVGSSGQLTGAPFVEVNIDGFLPKDFCRGPYAHLPGKSPTRVTEIMETFRHDDENEWLNTLVRSWKNPVFETVEPTVYQLPTQSAVATYDDENRHPNADNSGSVQVSKNALKEADVIAQLDKKFVLIRLPFVPPVIGSATSSSQTQQVLFAVDQHAADERCKLEELMVSYFDHGGDETSAVIEILDLPMTFEILTKEARLFARRQQFWRKWGIRYDMPAVEPSERKKTPSTIRVIGLPPSILERCRAEPQLLIDLIRRDMWRAEEDSGLGCAIMFNDELTMAECAALIRRLAQCALPFQCAHGRPSMAPLVNLGDTANGMVPTLPSAPCQDNNAVPVLSSSDAWETWAGLRSVHALEDKYMRNSEATVSGSSCHISSLPCGNERAAK
ncbi:hypothetical protein PWT90_09275 [Aphanocladium album]|nr:hypothetical protein PWT90_09275 [Aphanocladium album]